MSDPFPCFCDAKPTILGKRKVCTTSYSICKRYFIIWRRKPKIFCRLFCDVFSVDVGTISHSIFFIEFCLNTFSISWSCLNRTMKLLLEWKGFRRMYIYAMTGKAGSVNPSAIQPVCYCISLSIHQPICHLDQFRQPINQSLSQVFTSFYLSGYRSVSYSFSSLSTVIHPLDV